MDDSKLKVRAFFASYSQKRFTKQEILVQAGEDPPGVFLLEEGLVQQYDIAKSGASVVVNVFKPGAFFPMSWAINKTPNDYFYEATNDVQVRLAPAADVVAFLHDNPDVTFALLSRVYRGTDGLLRRMAHLMGGQAKTRLRFELLNAAYRFGESRPDGSVFVPLKESEIAQRSGLARETINRNLHSLKQSGLIDVTHRGFIVHDIQRLESELGDDV